MTHEASPERIEPFCPHFGICGGCAIQHWESEHYRAWKRDIVVETLARAKIDCEVDALVDAHGIGRRRITLHARMGTHEVLKVGFSAAGLHDIIPVDRCPILDPGLSGALDAAWALAEPLIVIGKPLDIQITATDVGLDVDVRGSGPLPSALIATLSRLAERHRLARLTRHGELVLMRTPPTIAMGAAQVTLPPGSFLQATVAGEEALAALVSQHCKRSKHIADLFCGVGPFALRRQSLDLGRDLAAPHARPAPPGSRCAVPVDESGRMGSAADQGRPSGRVGPARRFQQRVGPDPAADRGDA